MNEKDYNGLIENYKNNMTKKQQIVFLCDVLDMNYSVENKNRFIKILKEDNGVV